MCQFTSWLTKHFDYVLELIATNLPLGHFAHARVLFTGRICIFLFLAILALLG